LKYSEFESVILPLQLTSCGPFINLEVLGIYYVAQA